MLAAPVAAAPIAAAFGAPRMTAPFPPLLVIDDERVDRAIAVHAASRAGFQAEGVSGVDEARALLAGGAVFAAVLLDLSLGRDDGLRALHMLAEFNSRALVVFASGFDGRVLGASRQLAMALGLRVGGVLRKPIRPEALSEMLLRPQEELRPIGVPAPQVVVADLRNAIAEGEIVPWFQPKLSLGGGEIVGAEALARWVRPDGVMIAPMHFLPTAEDHGLMLALTQSILDQSLKVCADLRRHRPDFTMAVNLSPLLLDDPTLTDRIDRGLEASGVPAMSLVLEITEGLGIPDTACATEILTRLRIRGVSLSVDDFGTGFSSLLSLVRMPFSELKIDQAFVREADRPGDCRKVVYAAAALGRQLGLTVVAEGVETQAVARAVQDAGCRVGQGFLFGRAMPAAAFETTLLRSGQSQTAAAAAMSLVSAAQP
jgi:EAL domain-containing protein (putative c-di-GMP-specific phosphodiesterase class I)